MFNSLSGVVTTGGKVAASVSTIVYIVGNANVWPLVSLLPAVNLPPVHLDEFSFKKIKMALGELAACRGKMTHEINLK
jgi:hypothetical protein